jgi:Cd2+/Zn2+-exporting ATPase
VLFGLANLLESWSVQRVRSAVLALVSQVPAEARVKTESGERLIPVGQVRPGQTVLVLPGERIPLDGHLVAGQGHVDQSPITGESRPIEKLAGSEVFAGSINQDAALDVQVSRPASRSVMAQVIRLVRQGQANKSRREQLVDRFARYYTPAVLAGAVLIAAVPPLLGVLPWSEAIMRALVLLVISCPCALVISTPVAIVSAMTALARGGALVKAGRILEVLAEVRAVALDKTGTLTLGEPVVDRVIPLDGYTSSDVLRIAACVESRSEHSLARAILDAARRQGLDVQSCSGSAALPGMGAIGQLNGATFVVGNARLLRERGIPLDAVRDHLERHEDCRHTAMVVASSERPIGIILAADRIRAHSRAAIDRLRASGLRTVMLTGDNHGTARAIGEQSQVDEVRAELLPADKVQAVADLRSRFGAVAMVGDGINDAPALAAADVGIAMGTIGTDAAIQTADVALMSDNLWHLPWLLDHARRTHRTIIVNIVAAVGIKAVFLALASVGLANLWMAILADMGASLAVTFNGMRLLNAPHPPEPATAEESRSMAAPVEC